jgi:asparagine synthase (glutamine-hydrolysing)
MTGVCGWFSIDTKEDTALPRMARALTLHEQNGSGNSAGQLALHATGPSQNYTRCPQRNLQAAIIGHPRWGDEQLQRHAREHGAAEALLMAYQRRGPECLKDLRGFFALAVLDPVQQTALLAIDRIGAHSLVYSTPTQGGLVFGSTVTAVRSHPATRHDIDPQALYDYTYFHAVPSPGSIYREIRKLEPAQYLLWREGQLQLERYWQPDFEDGRHGNLVTLGAELRDTLSNVVSRYQTDAATGSFLSGGLDSSTVSGVFANLNEKPVPAYSIGFSEKGYDEIGYARTAARHFGLDLHEYYVTPDDIANAIPQVARAYDEPFGNSSAIPALLCARLAHDNGTQVMLAGDGGDELFAGNERYAQQQLFQHYFQLPAWLRGTLLEPLFLRPAIARRFTPTRKVARYIEQAKMPMPGRMQSYNFLNIVSPQELFQPGFFDSVDSNHPASMLDHTYHEVRTDSMLHRMLYLDWKITLADNDLRKVNKMCELAGVDVYYPLLDDDIIELSTRIPPALKLKGQKLRYFFKQALKDFLPEAIINKPKHGFGLPFGQWLKLSPLLQDTIYDSLNDLKGRQIFQPQFIDRLIDEHRTGHAAFYGTMVWVLAMLEQWYQHHYDNKN